MLGYISAGKMGSSPSGARFFKYEVVGMRQNDETDKTEYQIRSSGSRFVIVPYNRMNQEMRRINRMGGKIVSIEPMTTDNTVSEAEGE
uniref:CpcD n=3 Tax=Limnospira platensis TaxID=118562 RepID=B2BNA8_LIMPL|nr:CpcD [Arthrospira platensis Sp-11]